MNVLVINAGSSSLKYQFIRTENGEVVTKGLIEKIGGQAEYSWQKKSGEKVKESLPVKDHTGALQTVIENMQSPSNGFISSLADIEAVGHRVVHGGDEFYKSVQIDEKVIASITKFSELAPLHNPPNLQGIESCRAVLPGTRQVAVFDTAFHQTMPESSYLYPLPWEYYEKYRIRRYGFHGTSHRYVSMKAAEFLGKPLDDFNCITCHLGNGSSITAIRGGKSVDTTMGLTPLEGVMMGTRSGTIDPAIVFFLMEKENLSPKQVSDVLNKKSGILGLSGVSNDLREVNAAANSGNRRAQLTREVLVKTIRRAIGAYMAELGRVDAIIFTAGIGENEYHVRENCVADLQGFGIDLDEGKNEAIRGELADVSTPDSRTKVLVVPTNEELMIALETRWVIEGRE